MFCWGSAGRLRPMRMVWLKHNYNQPRYELVKWRQPSLRQHGRVIKLRGGKVEWDRETRQHFPGETGKWPLNKVRLPRDRKSKRRIR